MQSQRLLHVCSKTLVYVYCKTRVHVHIYTLQDQVYAQVLITEEYKMYMHRHQCRLTKVQRITFEGIGDLFKKMLNVTHLSYIYDKKKKSFSPRLVMLCWLHVYIYVRGCIDHVSRK